MRGVAEEVGGGGGGSGGGEGGVERLMVGRGGEGVVCGFALNWSVLLLALQGRGGSLVLVPWWRFCLNTCIS